MSLRARLSILITLLFLLILVGGSIFIIGNARRAIHDEVQSAARFTLQLIEIALSSVNDSGQSDVEENLLSKVSRLESSRHLQIRILNRTHLESRLPASTDLTIKADAPDWFVQLVKPQFIEYRRVFSTGNNQVTEILIRADPSDEISEVWQDSKDIIAMFVLFVVMSILIVYYTLGRGLAPISVILKGLEGIERGEYRLRLPKFRLTELSQISEKFNLMASVLDKTQQENRELTQKSLAIQERERQNLAHELHDELGQSIAAIKAVATSIGQSDQDKESMKDSVNTILEVSNHMYDVARGMMRRLRPAVLDEFGLVRALQDMIDDWNTVHEDVFCEFEFHGDFEHLDEAVRISIYRIVQESLTNVIKHSGASKVMIEFNRVADSPREQENFPCHLELKIVDNGVGFNDSTIKRGLGFLGMQERIDALDGSILIESGPGKGVSIHIIIPLRGE
ncbi:MAG: histidine kinase [Gammaproteobacteria bacterium]|nr:histidine kinase [Gammaproteobacteria bacterium]